MIQVIHPRDFPAVLGIARVPTKNTLRNWRQRYGFPQSLSVPRGHYRLDEVRAWLDKRAKVAPNEIARLNSAPASVVASSSTSFVEITSIGEGV